MSNMDFSGDIEFNILEVLGEILAPLCCLMPIEDSDFDEPTEFYKVSEETLDEPNKKQLRLSSKLIKQTHDAVSLINVLESARRQVCILSSEVNQGKAFAMVKRGGGYVIHKETTTLY